MNEPRTRPLILITLAGGGYGRECSIVIRALSEKADFIYTRPRSGVTERPGNNGIPDGPQLELPDLETVGSGSRLTSLSSGVVIFFKTLRFLLRHRPDCVAGITARESVFVLSAARLLGIETVFLESVTRVSVPSLTLKLIARLRLSRNVWVQWPELVGSVPNARFRGRVL
jgi:hypothetical protein